MTAQFRIGGVYRNGHGAYLRLEAAGHSGRAAPDGFAGMRLPDGFVLYQLARLSDGRVVDEDDLSLLAPTRLCLLPGELHNVNGQWVPVAEEAPKTECEVEPFSSRACELGTRSCTKTHDTDPVRPPLTWATPKPVDRWEGYVTLRTTVAQDPTEPVHPLQRMTDPSDPLHGSAWLKVR